MRFLTFLYLLLALVGYPATESPLPEILDTYGGQEFLKANSRLELAGIAENQAGQQAFTLQISEDKSLFSTAESIAVRDGSLGQDAKVGEARSQVRRIIHGTQEVFLVPQVFVAQLENFEYEGRADDLDWFAAEVLERRFIGYNPPPQTIRLAFDSKSHLLVAAQMHDPKISEDPLVVSYSGYESVSGIPVPTEVTRSIRDQILLAVQFTSIDWSPAFRDEDLDLTKGGD
jgi:hypothetical protein